MPGEVYTKRWVVELMLDMAGYVPDADLVGGVALEPSCGCGSFLAEMTRRLIKNALRSERFTPGCIAGSIRAFDINEDSVESSRRLVASLLADAGMEARQARRVAQGWVRCADALLEDFPDADWVLGNPPYVRSGHIDKAKRAEYARRLDCATMGTDLYVGFFELGMKALKKTGRLCYICADRWLQNRYGTRLRSLLGNGFSLNAIVRLHGVDVFQREVSAYPAITLIDRSASPVTHYAECAHDFNAGDARLLLRWLDGETVRTSAFSGADIPRPVGSAPLLLASPDRVKMLSALASAFPRLEESGVKVGIGVASGCDEVFLTTDENVVESDRLLPIFFMRDWRRGIPQRRCLVNPWDTEGNLVDLGQYPKLRTFLKANEGRLRRRRIARDNPGRWYRTLDKPDYSLAGREMLLFPDMSAQADPVLSDGRRYPHHNCYWMVSKTWDLKVLGGLLMSDIAEAFVGAYGVKMRGGTLRFQAQYLRMVHVPRYEDIAPSVRVELARAFEDRNREAASDAAHKAYHLEQVAV